MSILNYSHGDLDDHFPGESGKTAMQTEEKLQEDAVWMLLRRHYRRSGTVRSRLPNPADVQRDAIRMLSRRRVTGHWTEE